MPTTVRILIRRGERITDSSEEFDLSTFGGIVPVIGDQILDPGVPSGLDRSVPSNRTIWTVVQRILNPGDHNDFIALVVEERPGRDFDRPYL